MLKKILEKDEKQKFIEYRKTYYSMRKNTFFIIIRKISFKNNDEKYKNVLKDKF